jgi:hypothetical protein
MKIVELNGFDEGGHVGEDLYFVRVGVSIRDQYRPFICNILHFQTPLIQKSQLRSFSKENQQKFLREMIRDPNLDIDFYVCPHSEQLVALKSHMTREMDNLFIKRGQLITALRNHRGAATDKDLSGVQNGTEDLTEYGLREGIEYLRKFRKPGFLLEAFVKALSFKSVVEDLRAKSKVLSNTTIEDYLVSCQVDGGFPFVFWWKKFFDEVGTGSRIVKGKFSVSGISNGDEYYPLVNMAGTLASIVNSNRGTIYPRSANEISPTKDRVRLDEYSKAFVEATTRNQFYLRTLFVGEIPPSLQHMIPFIQHEADNHRIYEPFAVHDSLKDFYTWYGEPRYKDVIVRGHTKTEGDRHVLADCRALGLDVLEYDHFIDSYSQLLAKIREEAEISILSKQCTTSINECISRLIGEFPNHKK